MECIKSEEKPSDYIRRSLKVDGRSLSSSRLGHLMLRSEGQPRISAYEYYTNDSRGNLSARDISDHCNSEHARTMACALNAYRNYMRDEYVDEFRSKPKDCEEGDLSASSHLVWKPLALVTRIPPIQHTILRNNSRPKSASKVSFYKSKQSDPCEHRTPRTACIANFVLLNRNVLKNVQNPLVKKIREMQKFKRKDNQSNDSDYISTYRSDAGCFNKVRPQSRDNYIVHPDWVSELQKRFIISDKDLLTQSLNVSRCPLRDRHIANTFRKSEKRHYKNVAQETEALNIYDLAVVAAPPPSTVGSAGYVTNLRRCRSAPPPNQRPKRSRNPVTWNPAQ